VRIGSGKAMDISSSLPTATGWKENGDIAVSRSGWVIGCSRESEAELRGGRGDQAGVENAIRGSRQPRSGSPISRQVSRGTDVPVRIFLIPFFSSRGLCDSLIDAPLFQSVGVGQPLRGSSKVQGFKRSTVQRFKSSRLWELSSPGSDLPPLAIFICPRKLSVPRRVQGYRITDPLALPVRGPTLWWLTAWASIESQHRRIFYMMRDGIAANRTMWF
jgi:hypothetical protein